jgi:hypothetical protein
MIEIIALIFLCKRNGELAIQKGLKAGIWKMYTILAWLIAEVIGIATGFSMFGKQNFFAVASIGLFTAFGGYLAVKFILENKPDAFNNDIKRVSSEDLAPRKADNNAAK